MQKEGAESCAGDTNPPALPMSVTAGVTVALGH